MTIMCAVFTSRPGSPAGPVNPGGPTGPGGPRSPPLPGDPCLPGSPCGTDQCFFIFNVLTLQQYQILNTKVSLGVVYLQRVLEGRGNLFHHADQADQQYHADQQDQQDRKDHQDPTYKRIYRD